MKVSEFIRQWHLTGAVPEVKEPSLAIWAGWLVGAAQNSRIVISLEQAREVAIQAAEFIEGQAQ